MIGGAISIWLRDRRGASPLDSAYQPGWTSALVPLEMVEADDTRRRDIDNTKIVAKAICQDEGREFCRCLRDDDLRCHAVKRYVKRALRIVGALRTAGSFR